MYSIDQRHSHLGYGCPQEKNVLINLNVHPEEGGTLVPELLKESLPPKASAGSHQHSYMYLNDCQELIN